MLGDTNIKLLKARINHLLLPKYPKYAGIYIYLVQQLLMGFEQILIFFDLKSYCYQWNYDLFYLDRHVFL